MERALPTVLLDRVGHYGAVFGVSEGGSRISTVRPLSAPRTSISRGVSNGCAPGVVTTGSRYGSHERSSEGVLDDHPQRPNGQAEHAITHSTRRTLLHGPPHASTVAGG